MNIPQERLAKFKQELGSILFLSAIQIMLKFNFPAIGRLGSPRSTLVNSIFCVFSVLVYIYVFSYADTYVQYLNFAYLDDAPEPWRSILKTCRTVWFTGLVLGSTFYIWYTDYYRISNIRYMVLFAYEIVALMLIARAINRRAPGFK